MALTRLTGRLAVAAAGWLASVAPVWAGVGLDLAAAAEVGSKVRDFQLLIFALCAAIAIGVLGAMIWSTVHHRKSRGAPTGNGTPSVKSEIAWTVIPIAIFVAMAAPAADTLLRNDGSRGGDFTVKVTGYQWKWEYEYLDHDIRYSSLVAPAANPRPQPGARDAVRGAGSADAGDQPLVVPAGARVRVQLTSGDVNHGWWVRELGRRQNAIPGHINEFTFRARKPGRYRSECTEFCGPGETCEPIVIRVLPPEEFAGWLQAHAPGRPGQPPVERHAGPGDSDPVRDLNTMLTQGRMLHVRNCAGCHQASGQGLRAAGFPPLAGTRVNKDEHIRVALHGREGSGMAGFGSYLGDAELAAIVTYQRNAWGNDTGDVVDPADVAAAR